MTDFTADLIAVDSREHQIQNDQIRAKRGKFFQCFFSVIYDFCLKAFFGKIQGDELCDVVIVIDNENFLFGNHGSSS